MSKKTSKNGSPAATPPRGSVVKQLNYIGGSEIHWGKTPLNSPPQVAPDKNTKTLIKIPDYEKDLIELESTSPSGPSPIVQAKKGKVPGFFNKEVKKTDPNKSSPTTLSPRSSLDYNRKEDNPYDTKLHRKSLGSELAKHTKHFGTNEEEGGSSKHGKHLKKDHRKSVGDVFKHINSHKGHEAIEKSKDNLADNIAKTIIKKINKGDLLSSEIALALITEHNKDYQDAANSLLMHAVYKENLSIVQKLLQLKANVNLKNRDGDTALMLAIKTQGLKIINEILNVPDIDLDSQNNHGDCALMLAIKYELKTVATDIVNKLPNFSLYNIPAVLKQAVESHNLFLVEAILQRKDNLIDKEKQDIEKQEILSLMKACQEGQKDIVAILVRFNCPIRDGIEATSDNPEIIHLIKIGRLIDKSYVLQKDIKDVAFFNELIEQGDNVLFASRLLRTIKDHGLNSSFSLDEFYNKYTQKYKSLFRFHEGLKIKDFLDYLKDKFTNPADFITDIKPEKWLKSMDHSGEAYRNLQSKIKGESQKLTITAELQELLKCLTQNPYDGNALESLNLILPNQHVLSIIAENRQIARKLISVEQALKEAGLGLHRLNDIVANDIVADMGFGGGAHLSERVANNIERALTRPLTYEELHPYNSDPYNPVSSLGVTLDSYTDSD